MPISLTRDLSGTYVPSWAQVSDAYRATAGSTPGTFSPANGSLRLVPLLIPSSCTVDRIGCEVTTGGTSGAVVRLGIYDTGTDGLPETLILDAGTRDTTSTGFKEITISQALDPGLYWLGVVTQGSPATPPTYRKLDGVDARLFTAVDRASVFNSAATAHLGGSSVTGALPSTVNPTPSAIQSPACFVRFA